MSNGVIKTNIIKEIWEILEGWLQNNFKLA